MIRAFNEEDKIRIINANIQRMAKKLNRCNCPYIFVYIYSLAIFFIIILISIYIILNKREKIIENKNINKISKFRANNINIDYNDEFFKIKEVNEQIINNNINQVKTLSGGFGNVGNALIILNTLINMCEKIKCKNIIAPDGLQNIIKKPILDKEYNIIIWPHFYKNKIKIDINLSAIKLFSFRYKKKFHEMRLNIIKDEVFSNIPKYKANNNDLYINIRSGEIFIYKFNRNYAQPPLCFYKKIIEQNKYDNIYILSNGHENPVVDNLLEKYPKIKYIHGSVEYDISILVNAYNLVLPISTFPLTLIRLNNNLRNVYVYGIINYNLIDANYTIYKMEPSKTYLKKMKRKWKNSNEQLDLMINENCYSSSLIQYVYKNTNRPYVDF